jgi:signal transduction histidine kinase
MPRSFVVRLSGLVALVGFVFVVVLAAFAVSITRAFRADDEALMTYAEEMVLGEALEESVQRKLAAGRGYLLGHDEHFLAAFDEAATDQSALYEKLRARVTSREGVQLLDVVARSARAHDQALRDTLAIPGTTDEIARHWSAEVAPLAVTLRTDLEVFIRHKRDLLERAKQTAMRAQERAVLVSGAISLAAILGGAAGGIFLFRSARTAFRLQIDARTAAEAERAFFTSMMDQLPIGVMAADATGRILYVSDWARRLLSREDPRIVEAPFVAGYEGAFFHMDGAQYAADELPLSRALRGEVVHAAELRGPKGCTYSVTAGPIRDAGGVITAAVAGFADVTDRKEAERERELFIGVLAHDLRNPLNAISLAADSMQRRGDLPELATRPAARIASSAHRMSRLIAELLDFARSQSGTIPIHPQPCQLKDIAAEVIDEVRTEHPNRVIRIEAQGGCDGRYDANRIAQVFQNVIGNAVQHGAPDEPIEIQTGATEDRVWARVTNRGQTIPPAESKRIFEPFRSSAGSKGLGLGLYIARAIVQAHGGTISVDSKDGATTFTIELPRRVPPRNDAIEPRPMA